MPARDPGRRHETELIWLGLGVCLFAATASIAYRPTLDGPATIAAAAIPLVTLAGLAVALTGDLFRPSSAVTAAAVTIAIGGWGLLLLGDDRWSILSLVIYAACYRAYSEAPYAAIASSAAVTGIWVLAWSTGDTPRWTVVVPLAVFVAGTALYSALRELGRLNREQAELIAQLRSTRDDLAAAERAKGSRRRTCSHRQRDPRHARTGLHLDRAALSGGPSRRTTTASTSRRSRRRPPTTSPLHVA